MLRQLFVMLLVSVMGFSVAVEHAEARRMGGGGNVGGMSRSADRPASTPSTQQAQGGQQGQAGAAAARRGGMGGMMGGLLAGGLIAALFFGGAFDELRMMDLLMVVGIAVLAMIAFRAFIRQRRPAHASESNYQRTQHVPSTPAAGSAGAAPGSLASSLQSTPAWFDKEQFLNGAKEHFMTLQRAWDNNDFSQIQEYVTPELYNLLRTERAQHPANNRTEIVRLFAELGDINEYDGHAEASVIFHGIIEENGQQTEFNESWHLTRAMRDQAPWYVQGIEQNPGA